MKSPPDNPYRIFVLTLCRQQVDLKTGNRDWTDKEIQALLRLCTPENADTQADFVKLSLEDKLRWISISARMAKEYTDLAAFDAPVPAHWPPLPPPRR